MYCLITGGLGYIGSHTIVKLIENNYTVVILDNLANSNIDVIDKIESITNVKPIFIKGDIQDRIILNKIFANYHINFVIHFAGLKSVNESVSQPLKYYNNNVYGTINLLTTMNKHNCKKLIFSSSATVYGDQQYPVNELAETGKGITNPYGQTKYQIENILKDLYTSDTNWSIIILRYFNPIGAHESGLLNENPQNVPNNLFPYIIRVAERKYDKLKIFGNDYDTIDGTCVRDYIHVSDLADGHIAALNKINDNGLYIYNLGTGVGVGVLELIKAFEKVNGVTVPYEIVSRRIGDLPCVYADVSKAKQELGWQTKLSIDDCVRINLH